MPASMSALLNSRSEQPLRPSAPKVEPFFSGFFGRALRTLLPLGGSSFAHLADPSIPGHVDANRLRRDSLVTL